MKNMSFEMAFSYGADKQADTADKLKLRIRTLSDTADTADTADSTDNRGN